MGLRSLYGSSRYKLAAFSGRVQLTIGYATIAPSRVRQGEQSLEWRYAASWRAYLGTTE